MLTIRLLKLIIYLYWILNFTRKDRKKIKRFLIIYPYWILNDYEENKAWELVKAYNLSILDFKCNCFYQLCS